MAIPFRALLLLAIHAYSVIVSERTSANAEGFANRNSLRETDALRGRNESEIKLSKVSAPTFESLVTDKPSVTMVLLDQEYLDFFPCWVDLFVRHSSNPNLHVVALDATATKGVSAWAEEHPHIPLRVSTVFSDQGKEPTSVRMLAETSWNESSIWPSNQYQEEIWKSLLQRMEEGYKEVLHADLDVWFRSDPWKWFDSDGTRGLDIVASMDGCYPEDVCETWNNHLGVINVGFTLFRNTPGVRKILAHLHSVWEMGEAPSEPHNMSDQFMLNRHLASLGCTWEDTVMPPHVEAMSYGNCGDVAFGLMSKDLIWKTGGSLALHSRNPGLLKKNGIELRCDTPKHMLIGDGLLAKTSAGIANQRAHVALTEQ